MKRTIVLSSLIVFASGAVSGQTATPPAFEIASVKPNKSGSSQSRTRTAGGELIRTNVTLYDCIKDAYGLSYYNLSGPDWLKSEKYDINAKAPSADAEDRLMAMLQTLLRDRFKLTFHRETKVLPVYALTVAKGGSKLQKVEADGESGSGANVNNKGGSLWARKISISSLADLLSRHMDRPVRDLTGVDGVFAIPMLEWSVDDNDMTKPSLFVAMQERLGLKLEAKKLPVEILVVDHAEKMPTEN